MVHEVRFTIPERELGNADIEFSVRQDGELLGRLAVSKGAVVWVPRDHTYGFKMQWADFAELLVREGKSEK